MQFSKKKNCRFFSSSILCGVINKALWTIFVVARLFVLARYHVNLGDFLGAFFGLFIRLLLPALCSYGFESCMHLRRGAVP